MRLHRRFPYLRVSAPLRQDLTRASHTPATVWTVWLFSAIVWVSAAALAHGQQYTSIVVFGDSLSDTGNIADLAQAKYGVRFPGPIADYTDGRFTDGLDTYPTTVKYDGVWVEQLAAMLPTHPPIKASLDGGTNYSYGFAKTGGGTTVVTYGPGNFYSVTVNNVGQQISTYLATHPHINNRTLFVVWAGAIDVLYASSPQDVIDAAIDQATNVNRLVDAGASRILIANLPPLGDIPRLNTMPAAAAAANQGTALFNDTLSAGLDIVEAFHFWDRPHLYRLNVASVFNNVLAMPATYGLTNVTMTSQGVLTTNPDRYLFWDDLHPTTSGHHILALAALKLVDPHACFVLSGPWYQPSCAAVP